MLITAEEVFYFAAGTVAHPTCRYPAFVPLRRRKASPAKCRQSVQAHRSVIRLKSDSLLNAKVAIRAVIDADHQVHCDCAQH